MKRFALVVEADPQGAVRWMHVGEPRFLDDDRLVIGRDRFRAQLVVQSDMVARMQCALQREALGFSVVDEHSTGGTWLNGRRVVGRQRLDTGDRFRFGDVVLRFDVVDTDPLARAKAVRSLLLLDGDNLEGPGRRRAYKAGAGFVTLISSTAPVERSPLEPPLVDEWARRALLHRAFATGAGVPLERVLDHEGTLDLAAGDRILADAVDLCDRVLRPARAAPRLSDVVVTWAGRVVIVPTGRADVVEPHLSRFLFDLSHALPAGQIGFTSDSYERRMIQARERARLQLFPVASDDALAALVRGLFPAEHRAHVELAEQLAMLDDAGVARLASRRG